MIETFHGRIDSIDSSLEFCNGLYRIIFDEHSIQRGDCINGMIRKTEVPIPATVFCNGVLLREGEDYVIEAVPAMPFSALKKVIDTFAAVLRKRIEIEETLSIGDDAFV